MHKYIKFFDNVFKAKDPESCRANLRDLTVDDIFLCRNRINPEVKSIGRLVKQYPRYGYAKVIWLREDDDELKGSEDKLHYDDSDLVVECFKLV